MVLLGLLALLGEGGLVLRVRLLLGGGLAGPLVALVGDLLVELGAAVRGLGLEPLDRARVILLEDLERVGGDAGVVDLGVVAALDLDRPAELAELDLLALDATREAPRPPCRSSAAAPRGP